MRRMEFDFRFLEFEMPRRLPRGDTREAAGYMRLELDGYMRLRGTGFQYKFVSRQPI